MAAGAVLAALASGPAAAHPHVFAQATVTPVFDTTGRFSAVHEVWSLDLEFTDGAVVELDTDHDGVLTPGEIRNAGAVGVLWWIPYGFLTRVTVAGAVVQTSMPPDFDVRIPSDRMVLEFTLPLAIPLTLDTTAEIDVFDPEFYVDIQFADAGVDRHLLPAGCHAEAKATTIDPVAAMIIRRLGLPGDPAIADDPAAGYAVRVALSCGT